MAEFQACPRISQSLSEASFLFVDLINDRLRLCFRNRVLSSVILHEPDDRCSARSHEEVNCASEEDDNRKDKCRNGCEASDRFSAADFFSHPLVESDSSFNRLKDFFNDSESIGDRKSAAARNPDCWDAVSLRVGGRGSTS